MVPNVVLFSVGRFTTILMILFLFCRCVLFFVLSILPLVWPSPAYSVSSTYVDLNLPAASQPGTEYDIFMQRSGQQSFSYLASYEGIALDNTDSCSVTNRVLY